MKNYWRSVLVASIIIILLLMYIPINLQLVNDGKDKVHLDADGFEISEKYKEHYVSVFNSAVNTVVPILTAVLVVFISLDITEEKQRKAVLLNEINKQKELVIKEARKDLEILRENPNLSIISQELKKKLYSNAVKYTEEYGQKYVLNFSVNTGDIIWRELYLEIEQINEVILKYNCTSLITVDKIQRLYATTFTYQKFLDMNLLYIDVVKFAIDISVNQVKPLLLNEYNSNIILYYFNNVKKENITEVNLMWIEYFENEISILRSNIRNAELIGSYDVLLEALIVNIDLIDCLYLIRNEAEPYQMNLAIIKEIRKTEGINLIYSYHKRNEMEEFFLIDAQSFNNYFNEINDLKLRLRKIISDE